MKVQIYSKAEIIAYLKRRQMTAEWRLENLPLSNDETVAVKRELQLLDRIIDDFRSDLVERDLPIRERLRPRRGDR